MVSPDDLAAVELQLHRPPRATRAVAHSCDCGLPDVVETSPRLDDGTPFPWLYYLTCPRARAAIGRLEASGLMREMTSRLETDPDLASRYEAAHQSYLARRNEIEPLGSPVTAGGMPNRVKCLHVLVAHSLAAGPGVNPFGDEALALLDSWGDDGPCVDISAPDRSS
ncbi:MAG: DUF501 domain-containing protein [Mycobacteriales bacterium]